MSTQDLRFVAFSAYASSAASILGFVFIALFIAAGQPFGSLNDFFGSVVFALSLMPLAVAFHRFYAVRNRAVSSAALVIGLVSMVVFVAAGALALGYAFNLVTFPEPRPGAGAYVAGVIAPAFVGVWLILVGYLGLQNPTLPKALNWLGILTGGGFVLTLIGFALGGLTSPLVAVSGLATATAFPIWAIWLGRVLLKMTAETVGAKTARQSSSA